MSSYEMIQAAAKRIGSKAIRTPLLSSPFLDEIAERKVYVKAECLQHTGSFKFRGGWSAVSAIPEADRKCGVIAFSSGNHAQGVSFAAKEHGIPAVIIMPSDAPKIKIENTKAFGAEVVLFDRFNDDRLEIANKANAGRNMTLIQPFDNNEVIAGQGTVGLEIAEQANDANIDAADVLVCCGGGGLTSGIALALERDAPSYTMRTCEPAGFDDVARSLVAGEIKQNAPATSICDAILTPQPGDITFPIMKRLCGTGHVVTEDECLHAMALAFERLKIVIEPGGAAALAAALFHSKDSDNDTMIAVATGGNVDAAIFQMALDKYGSKA
ncbi:threonine/serine dehydratase [Amylibacter sp. SFDW26]|uniref:threonine ammonia-lyase n=1 Tax=Amylibacter sp. SFDW26 TaxID=2652722 RepID=UPI001262924F|nr:threonine/serine dehydratase [Amylibacter sp. SFDW26]KAB7613343.1 threonine/serine dehydratase [Amylibacter sp. SFDW26]